MRLGAVKVVVLSMGCVVVGASGAAADKCMDTQTAIEKMQPVSDAVEKFDGKTVADLKIAFAEHYKHSIDGAEQALVFHRKDTPTIDWLILFKNGCAYTDGPIEEEVVRKAVMKSHDATGSAPDAAPAGDAGAK